MLPSTGLFKSINCPYYENNTCNRPYCHYKHTKKDEEPKIEKKTTITAVYNPTPKCILEADKQAEKRAIKKHHKLEYVPKPPKSVKNEISSSSIYIPSSTITTTTTIGTPSTTETSIININGNSFDIDLDGCDEEFDLISEIINSEKNDALKENGQLTESELCKQMIYVPTKILDKPKSDELNPILTENKIVEKDIEKVDKVVDDEKKSSKSENTKSSRSSSSSHSSTNKHKSSSNSKESSKDHNKSSSSSKHSSSRHSSSRHSRSHRSSESEKKSSSSSSRHHHHKSSSSSSSRHHKNNGHSKESSSSSSSKQSKTTKKIEPEETIENNDYEMSGLVSPSSVFDTDSDEDEIMKQCKMIFEEEFTTTNTQSQNAEVEINSHNDESKLEDTNIVDENAMKRKRVAHENIKNVYIKQVTPSAPKANHLHNAMQSIFMRQNLVKKQLDAAKEKEKLMMPVKEQTSLNHTTTTTTTTKSTKQKSEHSHNNHKNNHNINNNSNHNSQLNTESIIPIQSKQTNLTTISSLKQPTRIGAVSNVIALQNAKKKIEMLRMAKHQQIHQQTPVQTPAQTSSKGGNRIAHVNPALIDETKAAPAILEPMSTKISYNIRTQYYNLMVKHCLSIYPNCEDAWNRAQTLELGVMKKCQTPIIYKRSALLAINNLKKESIESGNIPTERNRVISHDVILAGKQGQEISWSVNKKLKTDASGPQNILDAVDATKAYKLVSECILTDQQLQENGYPRPGTKNGEAVLWVQYRPKPNNKFERYCIRCSKIFRLDLYDEDEVVDQCNYHPKSTGFRRGFADNLHRCCQQPAGTPGCMYGNYHVADSIDYDNLTGFVTTIEKDEDYILTKKDVFALDCEMCYTTIGLELTRITVVDINEKTIYDALVKPDNKIIDYNTTYSGITEPMLRNVSTSLRNVQAILLSMFHAKTILIGHSLDSDLKALKIIHSCVVDTSVLFPHKMGPPKKRALKTLSIENLKIIIQENEAGHDSAEDARTCIALIKHYLRNRIV